MIRREFLKVGAMTAAGFLTAPRPLPSAPAAPRRNESRPNILWITCEDTSPRLGCYGDRTVPTPNIDRLAREGVRYTGAFATTGVCAPSRHALITGMYPTSTYALQMRNLSRTSALKEIKDPDTRAFATTRPLYEAVPPAEVRCLTEYLRRAGYYCSNNVKQDYQFRAPVTAWDESSRQAHWRKRNPGQPFFAVFNFTVTHESGVFGKGRSPRVVDPRKVPLPPYYPDTSVVRTDLAKHYDNIAALDAQVGALLGQLEEDGLLEKTIVFFYSDHGDGLPRSKRWVYDSGTRVPLIVRHPGAPGAGTTSNRLVSFVDFGPTVLSLAGVDVPKYVHGVPFLGDQAGAQRKYVYFHRDRNGENRETIRAVRDGRFRYVRNYRPNEPYIKPLSYRDRQAIMQELNRMIDEGALAEDQWQFSARSKPMEEFYDTHADPFEIHNLASDPKYAEKMSDMRKALDAWVEMCDDPLDMPEDELVRTRVYPPQGRQPATATPTIRLDPVGERTYRLTVACETEGASIGFRTKRAGAAETNAQKDKGPWTIYDGPTSIRAVGPVEVVAHRIGFKPSPPVVAQLPRK
ncbi:MAG: sulfatase [Sedimentisphaerales bacterium]|nr:sulfatase [Sedimentisphaerales bacterium]